MGGWFTNFVVVVVVVESIFRRYDPNYYHSVVILYDSMYDW